MGCSTIFFSCDSEAGVAEDEDGAGLLGDAGRPPLDAEVTVDDELPQAATTATPYPTAQRATTRISHMRENPSP